jgi:hypothetical protein
MENIEKMLAKGRGDMHKAKDVVSKDPGMPASGKEFLGGLASAYDNMADAMEALSTLVSDMCKQKSGGGEGWRSAAVLCSGGGGPAKTATKTPAQP